MSIDTDGITCLDCGTSFVRRRRYVGQYCEACQEADADAE